MIATHPDDAAHHPLLVYMDSVIAQLEAEKQSAERNQMMKEQVEDLALQYPPQDLRQEDLAPSGYDELGLKRNPYCGKASFLGIQEIAGGQEGHISGKVHIVPFCCNRWNCSHCLQRKLRKHARKLTITGPVYHCQLFSPLSYNDTLSAWRRLIHYLRNRPGAPKIVFHRLQESRIDKDTGEHKGEVLYIFFKDTIPQKGTIQEWWERETGGKLLFDALLTCEQKVQRGIEACMMALSSDVSSKGARFRRASTSPGFWDELAHPTTNANEDTEWHFSPESWARTIQRLRAQHGFQVKVVTPGEYAVARWYGDPNLLPTYALAIDPVMHKRAEEPIEEAGGVPF